MTPTENQKSEKSVFDVINEGIGSENKEAIEKLFAQVRQVMDSSTAYINKNPREALVIAAAVGLGAWVLLNTKPGRVCFDKGCESYLPRLKTWLGELFATASQDKTKTREVDAVGPVAHQHH